MDMEQVEIWLQSVPSKQTKKSYKNSIRKFESWYQKPIESLLGNQEEATKAVERFFCYLKENNCQNTARNQTNGVVQYFKAHKTPIQLRKALNVYKTVATIRDHQLSVSEVQAMAKVADLREQMILKIGLFGLRIGDATELKWQTFDVQGETPIEIEIMTQKEDQLARTFIDEELKELLDRYLPTLDRNNPYLFQSKRQGNLSIHRLDEILKQLFERAGLTTQKILRWHCFRKLTMRTAMELGVNSWSIRMMVGKAVSADIATYISGVSLKEDFTKLSNVLKLKGPTNGNGKMAKLEHVILDLEKENASLKQRIEILQKNFQVNNEAVKILVENKLEQQGVAFKGRFKEVNWLEIYNRLKATQP